MISKMTYAQTLDWLYARLPMFQNKGVSALRSKLENITLFCEYLGCPERQFVSIHVAGTNGKGSSSHSIASILQEAGYRVGLYVSPHLKDFRERIRINGQMVSQDFVVNFVENHYNFLQENNLSFFELTVAMAFDYFATEKVDIAVIEVGLGGRFDSTNIIKPLACLITNIGKDHTDILGQTLSEIAYQKAGIIKEKTPVVISEYHPETQSVFIEEALKKQAPIIFAHNKEVSFETDLKGIYQQRNKKGVVALIEVLQHLGWQISQEHIAKGLSRVVANTGLMGRWQELSKNPRVICDTGHNAHGLQLVLEQLSKQTYVHLHCILGFVREKNIDEILPMFPKNATYYFCQPNVPRALSVDILYEKAIEYGLYGKKFLSVKQALSYAKEQSKDNDLIFIGGSTFVVAEII